MAPPSWMKQRRIRRLPFLTWLIYMLHDYHTITTIHTFLFHFILRADNYSAHQETRQLGIAISSHKYHPQALDLSGDNLYNRKKDPVIH